MGMIKNIKNLDNLYKLVEEQNKTIENLKNYVFKLEATIFSKNTKEVVISEEDKARIHKKYDDAKSTATIIEENFGANIERFNPHGR